MKSNCMFKFYVFVQNMKCDNFKNELVVLLSSVGCNLRQNS